MWKGALTVTKPGSGMCGDTYTQDGRSWFAAQAFAGGSLKAGGTPMAAPTVKVRRNGDVHISGSAVHRSGGTLQVVRYAILCTSRQACFGQKIPKPRKDLRIGWKYLGAQCIPGPGGTFRMRVRVRMIADNGDTSLFGRSWASGMTAGARLETTTPGYQFSRNWTWASKGGLVINRRYVEDFTIETDNVSAAAEWRLHLRYIWEVTGWRDIHRDVIGATPVVTCPG